MQETHMLYRIETGPRAGLDDSQGRSTAQYIESSLGLKVSAVRQVKVFTVDGLDRAQAERLVEEAIWHDPILQEASLEPLPLRSPEPAYFIEVGFRPGVTDNEARTARDTAAMVLDIDRESLRVYTAVQYQLILDTPDSLSMADVEHIASDLLCNNLIQRYRIKTIAEWKKKPGFEPQAAKVTGEAIDTVETLPLSTLDDEALDRMSHTNTWALSLEEMHSIRDHFHGEPEASRRAKLGLPSDPTDLEMEVMAQTWSEHCKHKIFASRIHYENTETGMTEEINNLYKTCIRDTTAQIRSQLGSEDFCKSVFSDNAGVIAFDRNWDACIKVETHNSPSALDPYGGALTGIVGVNRDPMGTGMGANLLCNTDVFCFASPFYKGELPPRLQHPRRVLEGVRRGVEDGGNKSGIPTVNGSVVFDDRYLGKPLVYCGTVGMLPTTVNGKPGWQKKAMPGDLIVMTGGRIGKDGIHGATFSSEELNEGSPATAVQIGDPITQRKMYDFIIKARDMGLYHAITDNGAGGLSSSVGEMAEDTNGCVLDISKAPLKYDGLRPWEILVSEAQERMTLAVPPEHIREFLAMAKRMDVEATVLGSYTDSGYFEVRYGGRVVGSIDMAFMHEGVPQFKLNACWERPEHRDIDVSIPDPDQGAFLKRMLGRLDICSKEYIVRQYDHEVKGGSVIKPLCGVKRDGPADAGVIRPVLESDAGLVISHGICPRYSDYDTYWMMANAMDEAIRNAVAVGGNPDHMAGVDNFCWCDPVESPKNPGRPVQAGPARARLQGPAPLLPGLRRALHLRQGLHEERLHHGRRQDFHPADGALLLHRRHQQRSGHADFRLQAPRRRHLPHGLHLPRDGRLRSRRGTRSLRRPGAHRGRCHSPAPLPCHQRPHGPARRQRLPRLLGRRPRRRPRRNVHRRPRGLRNRHRQGACQRRPEHHGTAVLRIGQPHADHSEARTLRRAGHPRALPGLQAHRQGHRHRPHDPHEWQHPDSERTRG